VEIEITYGPGVIDAQFVHLLRTTSRRLITLLHASA
jgi:hypothetical protein